MNEVNTISPLKNVALCLRALESAMKRSLHLPGMIAFYGPSGYGKTFAATYVANKHQAYHVACKSTWTKKALLDNILKEMGVKPASTVYEMADQVAEQLALSGRPLIVDEMDHLVEKSAVEIIRDIYETSFGTILLIGEENFPNKLRKWERFHNRVLEFTQAQPADIDDVRHLAKLYCPEVKIAADLMQRILEASRGAVRRVCVNLERVRNEARQLKSQEMDLSAWGKRELYTGDAPVRRIA